MHWLLVYELADDYLARRAQYRAEHLALAWALADQGDIALGGAVGDPPERAMLLFAGDTPEAAQRFAERDPYVRHGLVTGWRVLPWKTVVGSAAAEPLRPASADGAGPDRVIATSRIVAHPRERVFDAIRDGARLARWWGPDGFRNTFDTFEFEAGGRWHFTMHGPDGTAFRNESVFASIEPPSRVVIDHVSGHAFRLTIGLADVAGGTRVDWRMAFTDAKECARVRSVVTDANEQNLDRLEAELARGADTS